MEGWEKRKACADKEARARKAQPRVSGAQAAAPCTEAPGFAPGSRAEGEDAAPHSPRLLPSSRRPRLPTPRGRCFGWKQRPVRPLKPPLTCRPLAEGGPLGSSVAAGDGILRNSPRFWLLRPPAPAAAEAAGDRRGRGESEERWHHPTPTRRVLDKSRN